MLLLCTPRNDSSVSIFFQFFSSDELAIVILESSGTLTITSVIFTDRKAKVIGVQP